MLNRPTPYFRMVSFLLRPFIRWLRISPALTVFLESFWAVVSTLVAANGIFPTIRILWGLRRAIMADHPIEYLQEYGPTASRFLIDNLTPFWRDLILNRNGIASFLMLVGSTIFVYGLRPLVLFALRWLFRLILSSLGILWTENLRCIDFLFNYAITVKDYLKTILSIDLPIPQELRNPKIYKYLAYIGIPIVSVAFTLVGLDLYIHNLLDYLPFGETILNYAYIILTPFAISFRFIMDTLHYIRIWTRPTGL